MNDLSTNDWDNDITDTNAKYNIFISDLEHYVNKHSPTSKVNIPEQNIKTKPWISDQILRKIKQRKLSKTEYYQNYFEHYKNDMRKYMERKSEVYTKVNTKMTNLMNTSEIITNGKLLDKRGI